MSRILVLTAHPRATSFCAALAVAYAEGARSSGHEVRTINLWQIEVDLAAPEYALLDSPAPWVSESQTQIAWCEHLVIVAPMWWGGLPATFKLFIDRVLLPGFAFKYHGKGLGWDKLLAGRSAHVIITADTPPLIFRWLYGQPLVRQFKKQILGFCGFSPIRATLLGPIKTSTARKRQQWIDHMRKRGEAELR
ncbi:NAD(P)H-dependent oxidoreductase [Rhizobium sp. P007]|uniref:NAD(P)H-dependent oxidoreductase n=1 Tax=Rhizobium sp. P007 TaxID=285908 RepID=UPI00163BCE3B|nr:NAD(P)H-dependent oxidoreductase [Rhizobium sp. P007]CAD7038453.1 NAD(P)H dehydrogenase [Rhizobium sp. P007]